MFGYVQVVKDELKIKEYNVFRAYYCGLCKALGKEYGFAARLGLNYDSVFLAILLSSLEEEDPEIALSRCMVHPMKKRPAVVPERTLSYSANVMLILAILKLRDNMHDDKSIKSAFIYGLLLPTRRKIRKKHKTLYETCEGFMHELSVLEKAGEKSADKASHPFASMMETLFVPPQMEDETQKRILAHMGYLLGRIIYLLDAYEDYDKDKQKGRYNPYVASGTRPDATTFTENLTYTLATLAGDYDLLSPKRNRAILENLIYLGLPQAVKKVTQKGEAVSLENSPKRSIL